MTPFPDSGRKWPLSTGGGRTPLWSPNGRKIFYLEDGEFLSKIMEVGVGTSPEFESSSPKLVLEKPTMDFGDRQFGLSSDGEGIVMLNDRTALSGRIYFNVVLNWFDELEQLVPTP